MEALISGILEEKVNEIFKEMQERFNIKYGDVDPLDDYELMGKKIEMSVLIGKILRKQRGENK